ncbi:MAG: hypothetical protein LRY66_13405 [Saccharospirillaceae bacterium]|nr:hypothetical protein [Saccharospirillaceae bacterium]MCD8532307.1 hypothetical protein [Saccharospirillaceae bacterium]
MMDSALVYVLLLLGIAIGWTLGYRFARQVKKETPPDWIPSVEFLLAEANDASLERLLNIPQLDDDAIDLFLKLGRSLREKGEADRAIHLHQALFARTDLSRNTQMLLELELAVDYSYAGLLDRAERLFVELLGARGRVQEQASRYLVELYEEEGEWQRIFDLYREKKLAGNALLNRRVAHAVCELAEKASARGDYLETQQFCRQALKIDHRCARAFVVQGDLAYGQKEPREAIRCYLKAVDVDTQAIVMVLERMVESFRDVHDGSGLVTHLTKQWQGSQYVPALVAKAECEVEVHGIKQAMTTLLSELAAQPSNLGFFALVELVVRHKQQLDKSQLLLVYDILRRIVENEPKFVCKNCGFKAKEFHWRCPSCKDWSTINSFVPQLPKAKLDL